MRTDQRQQLLDNFQKATLPVEAQTSTDPEKMAAVGLVQAQYQQHVHQGGGQVSIQFHMSHLMCCG